MVIFGPLLVTRVVGVFWCFLLILGQMGIFGVGIFIDRWFFLLAWVFSPALTGSRRVGRRSVRISPDTRALSGDPVRYTYVYVYIYIYIVYNIRKKKKIRRRRRKERIDIYSFILFFFLFFFKKKY
jgi:hypothetical protein